MVFLNIQYNVHLHGRLKIGVGTSHQQLVIALFDLVCLLIV
jgi:hypothetical protein